MKHLARLVLLVSLVFCCLPAAGQKKEGGFFYDLNDFLDLRASRKDTKIDTTYIGRFPYHWDGRTFARGTGMHFASSFGDSELSTGMIPRIGVGITYRGIGLSYSRVLGKKRNFQFMLNAYGNHLGFEFGLFTVTEPKGYVNFPNLDYKDGRISNLLLFSSRLNILYSFNSRFSYAAAMKHSRIQRRSAGSVIAAFSWSAWDLLILGNEDKDPVASFFRLNYFYQRFSLGAGYGYNLVFGQRKWMYHISLIPMWSVYEMQGWRSYDERQKKSYPYGYIAFAGTARTGIYYRWGERWSLGLGGIINQMATVNKFSPKNPEYKRFGAQEWEIDLAVLCRF